MRRQLARRKGDSELLERSGMRSDSVELIRRAYEAHAVDGHAQGRVLPPTERHIP